LDTVLASRCPYRASERKTPITGPGKFADRCREVLLNHELGHIDR